MAEGYESWWHIGVASTAKSEAVREARGRIDAHQSGYVCPATLAFAHSYWDGEQLAVSSQNIKQSLNLDAFRAEFMGRNHGVPCEFLAYEKPGWSYDDALAITLLHDVMVRPCGFVSVPRLAPIWKALDDFGFADADWTPYWKNPVAVSPASFMCICTFCRLVLSEVFFTLNSRSKVSPA